MIPTRFYVGETLLATREDGTVGTGSIRPVTSPPARRASREPIDLAWASLTFLLPMLVSLLSHMGATDLAYHLRAGADVLAGHIPRVDTYTFTVNGASWLDQQWGAQGVFALVFKAGGWPTLLFAQGLLVGLTFFLVYLAGRAGGAACRTSALLAIAGFVVASPGLAMRPQLLALPLFGALLWVTAGRRRHPIRLWAAPALALVCANVHGSFTMFPLIVGLAWLEDRRTKDAGARRTLLVAAITALATLANPFGLRVWTYAYDLSTNPVIRDTISEWAPLTLATVPGWFAIGSALAVALFLIRRSDPTPWTSLLTLGIFFLLALSAQRAIVWWGMVAPVVLASLMPAKTTSEPQGRTRSPAAPAYAIVGVLLVGIVVLAPWWRGSRLRALPRGRAAWTHRRSSERSRSWDEDTGAPTVGIVVRIRVAGCSRLRGFPDRDRAGRDLARLRASRLLRRRVEGRARPLGRPGDRRSRRLGPRSHPSRRPWLAHRLSGRGRVSVRSIVSATPRPGS